MPEGLLRAGKVSSIDAMCSREVDGLIQDSVQVLDRVIEELDDILAAVGKGPRILEGGLIVVGRLGQTRRPGVVAVGELGLVFIGLAIAIGVDEKVGIDMRIVGDRLGGNLLGIGMNSLV